MAMQQEAYPSYAPGYPPPSPSSPYYQQSPGNQRRWSAEQSRPHTPSSRGQGARMPDRRESYDRPPSRSPLSHAGAAQGYHAASASDDYEERDLGEIAAANQAAQERNWGPHTALSEAAERTVGVAPGQYFRHNSMPPPAQQHYEPERYDGGFYLEPPGTHAAHDFGVRPGASSPSHASSHTLGANSRRSLPVYRSPSVQPSVTSPASEPPPNIFDVTARHHLPGGHARPEDMYDHRPYPSPHGAGEHLPDFPAWSQTWYGGHHSADGHAYTMVPPGSGQSGWESETLSYGRAGRGTPYGPYPHGHHPGDGRIADHVKEERIRMLEKEFGPKVSHKNRAKGADGADEDDEEANADDTEPLPLGSVDPKGRLVLPNRKLRIGVRWSQCLVSLTGAALGIGGYLLIKPKEDPAPLNTLPTWIMYIVSVLSTLVCVWLYALRPMCVNPLRKADTMSGGGPGGMGGMLIPVLGGGGPGGRGRPGGRMKRGMAQPGPTVNVIVDPTMLGKGHDSSSDSDSDSDSVDTLPGGNRRDRRSKRHHHRRHHRHHHRRHHHKGMLETIKMQAIWQFHRKWLKVYTFVDALFCLLWGVVAVWTIGFGGKCSPGSFEGWCDIFNGAMACAAINTAVFATAVYVDARDLKASERPPNAR
ncbi:uncharacterized protein PFL1_02340 [Pseudozyma flocculosa PF-1]|uniref:Uncharacterized protein n=1 Tax=Pseudozyma flocculosa TaxID=84751 RepID=A0A5C3F849_9BASI|nr:uncharacterized protein PFL1_02340 [Pseudozyma flocculosa PF-1]EPQ30224.1 hypothetical protein PFL1_02340 [Pseudozyma flocculosa PF-1]SPO39845.1 uncharacterized protein PSFLO_05326 [Pseudozyma flocculosa]